MRDTDAADLRATLVTLAHLTNQAEDMTTRHHAGTPPTLAEELDHARTKIEALVHLHALAREHGDPHQAHHAAYALHEARAQLHHLEARQDT